MQIPQGPIAGSAMRGPHICGRTVRAIVAYGGSQRNRPYKWYSPKSVAVVKENMKQAAGDAVQQLGSAMQNAMDKAPAGPKARKPDAVSMQPNVEAAESSVSSEDESPPDSRKGLWDKYPTML